MEKNDASHDIVRHAASVYFLLGVLLWAVVDFGTAGGFRLAYFQKYGPTLLLFYVGHPLIFTILIFRWHWSDRRLFVAMLVAIFLVEVVFTKNPLLMTFPALVFGIPVAIAVYTPLTFFPLWFVRRQMARNKALVIGLALVEVIVMILTTFGNSSA